MSPPQITQMLPYMKNILITKYVLYGILTYSTIIFFAGLIIGNLNPEFAPAKYYTLMTFLFVLINLMFLGLICLCSVQLYFKNPSCAICYAFSKERTELTSNGRKICRYRINQSVVGYNLYIFRVVTIILSSVFGIIFTCLMISGYLSASLVFLTFIAINAFFQLLVKCWCELKAYTKLYNESNDSDTINNCFNNVEKLDDVQKQMIAVASVEQQETISVDEPSSY